MDASRTWRTRLMAMGRLGLYLVLQVFALLIWASAWMFIRFFLVVNGVPGVIQFGIFELGLLLLVLLAVGLMCRFVEHRPLRSVGLAWRSDSLRQLLLGAGLGAAMVSCALLLGMVSGSFRVASGWAGPHYLLGWSIYVVIMLLATLVEELIFRGYLLQVLTEGLGPAGAVVLSALVAAAVQLQNPSAGWTILLGATTFGLLAGVVAVRTRTLWTVIGLHWAWTACAGGIFGLPKGGMRFGGAMFQTAVAGPSWWTGGAMGPEAGLVSVLALLLGWYWFNRWRQTRHST